MSSYNEMLRDPRWQRKRLCVMDRDGFRCRDCGREDRTLNVHHCHYMRGGPWETPDELLLTLCEECHVKRGKIEEQVKLALAETLANTHTDALSAMMATHGACAFNAWRREAAGWADIA